MMLRLPTLCMCQAPPYLGRFVLSVMFMSVMILMVVYQMSHLAQPRPHRLDSSKILSISASKWNVSTGRPLGTTGRPLGTNYTTTVPQNLSFTGASTTVANPLMSYSLALNEMQKLFKVKEVECRPLFAGVKEDIRHAANIRKTAGIPLTDEDYINMTSDCEYFKSSRGYITSFLSEEEKNFPLAFSVIAYKDSEMVERLLRAIYRPQNYYCIHVDLKSLGSFYRAISSIEECFPNVIQTRRRVSVKWGSFTVLEPELICMEDLWRFKNWKYFFTTTGQEFPLKTNYELVKILEAHNGANDVHGTVKKVNRDRWRVGPPPHGIRPVKGSIHIAVNREFVDYVLHNQIAKDLLNWTRRTNIPDETYFATLNNNPQLGIRGSYKGIPDTILSRPIVTRFKHRGSLPCAGQDYVRGVCILTTGDLPLLGNSKSYMANKFFLHQDRIVIGCLEEMIFNRTRDGYLGKLSVNTTYYANLDLVKNQVT